MKIWTAEQQEAIRARGSNLLVAAAAGAGKTTVLVERILTLVLEEGADIDSLLVVTFTKAAAGELRERLHQAFLNKLGEPGADQERIQRQLKRLHWAQISTINAFGMDVLKKYYYFLELDPNFHILEETERDSLQQEILDELLEENYERYYDQPDAAFTQLADAISETRGDERLKQLILNLYQFARTQPDPADWLERCLREFQTPDLEQTIWGREALRQAGSSLAGAGDYWRQALELAESAADLAGYLPLLTAELEQIAGFLSALAGGWDSLAAALETLQFKRLPSAPKGSDPFTRGRVKDLRDAGKKVVQDLMQTFALPAQAWLQDLPAVYIPMRVLADLTLDFMERFRTKKLAERGLDFSDQEHLALELLRREEVAQEYRNKFAHIFIDEYQDSNALQEAIIFALKREDNVFLVGDMKQSIYRFRSADPDLFQYKLNHYAAQSGKIDRKIFLNCNYRSDVTVIGGVNYLFNKLMSRALGDIDYDEDARLHSPETARSGEPVELLLLADEAGGMDGETPAEYPERLSSEEAPLAAAEAEALMVAQRIQLLLTQDIFDENTKRRRAVRYQDIAVLMRSPRGQLDTWLDIFRRQGIPVYSDRGASLPEAMEISLLVDLLRLLDNRRQDIPCLSVLRSLLGGFTEEELATVRRAFPEGSFYEAQLAYAAEKQADDSTPDAAAEKNDAVEQDEALAARLRDFNRCLERWQQQARQTPLEEFIWQLYRESNYDYYMAALPGGAEREINIQLLLKQARQFRTTAPSADIAAFIRHLDQLKNSKVGAGTGSPGEGDVVRLMSIHKSKGLEFPVVIVAGLGRKFNLRDAGADVLLHKDLGLGPRYYDHAQREIRPTLARMVMSQKMKAEQLSEEMRLLYVACTRAQQRLILSGRIADLDRSRNRWALPLSVTQLLRARTFLDWVGPVVMRHPDCAWGTAGDFLPEADLFGSRWSTSVYTPGDLRYTHREPELSPTPQRLAAWLAALPDDSASAAVERMNWVYPQEASTRLPSKMTVTQLQNLQTAKHQPPDQAYPLTAPAFSGTKPAGDPMERGSVTHFILKHLELNQVSSAEAIARQVQELQAREMLTAEEAALIDLSLIADFFFSEMGLRMRQSRQVFRETPFNLQLPAPLAEYPDPAENILLQGVIDVFFAEPGGWVLLDYKTDYVPEGDYVNFAERYRAQIELYVRALSALQSQPVKAAYIYLLRHRAAVAML
jgi:ATP-dependent helicase/nuclease subunit A